MKKLSLHCGQNFVDAASYGGWDGLLRACCNDCASEGTAAVLCGYEKTSLYDEEVTRDEFRSQWANAAAVLEDGDWFLCTNSGHGGDTGLVQTICLHDGELADWEIHNMIAAFKPGVNVIFVSDSCHSGGLDRDAFFRRPKFMHPLVGAQLKNRPVRGEVNNVACNAILPMACLTGETASDGQLNGMWTGARMQAFQTYMDAKKPLIWRDWFKAAKNLTTGQTPELKLLGPHPDVILNSFVNL